MTRYAELHHKGDSLPLCLSMHNRRNSLHYIWIHSCSWILQAGAFEQTEDPIAAVEVLDRKIHGATERDSATGRNEVSLADPASATKNIANSRRTC